MSTRAWVMMIALLAFNWGGFVATLVRSVRQERTRRNSGQGAAGAGAATSGSGRRPPL